MNKKMMLEAVDIIKSVSDSEKGLKGLVGKVLNKISYVYYKWI